MHIDLFQLTNYWEYTAKQWLNNGKRASSHRSEHLVIARIYLFLFEMENLFKVIGVD